MEKVQSVSANGASFRGEASAAQNPQHDNRERDDVKDGSKKSLSALQWAGIIALGAAAVGGTVYGIHKHNLNKMVKNAPKVKLTHNGKSFSRTIGDQTLTRSKEGVVRLGGRNYTGAYNQFGTTYVCNDGKVVKTVGKHKILTGKHRVKGSISSSRFRVTKADNGKITEHVYKNKKTVITRNENGKVINKATEVLSPPKPTASQVQRTQAPASTPVPTPVPAPVPTPVPTPVPSLQPRRPMPTEYTFSEGNLRTRYNTIQRGNNDLPKQLSGINHSVRAELNNLGHNGVNALADQHIATACLSDKPEYVAANLRAIGSSFKPEQIRMLSENPGTAGKLNAFLIQNPQSASRAQLLKDLKKALEIPNTNQAVQQQAGGGILGFIGSIFHK